MIKSIFLHTFSLHILLFLTSSLSAASSSFDEIKSALLEKREHLAGRLIYDHLDKTVSLQELKKLAADIQCTALLEAIQATESLYAQENDLDLKSYQYLQIAFFIEAKLSEQISKGNYFLLRKETGLDYLLEYDPRTQNTFILLEGDKNAYIGKGAKKSVNKAILYHKTDPQILARAEQRSPMMRELKMTKELLDAPGIMRTKAYTFGKRKGRNFTALYSDLYSPGSLLRVFEKRIKLSLEEKAKIVSDILKGLNSIHSRRIVHRDLHPKNFLLNITTDKKGKRKIEAVITDLGHSLFTCCANAVMVQGISRYAAPEGLFRDKMRGKDYFATDIYAVGTVFYRLFHEKIPSWQDRSYVTSRQNLLKKNHHILLTKLIDETSDRRSCLAKKSKAGLSTKEKLEYLILRMVDPSPSKRGSAESLSEEADKIYSQIK